MVIHKNVIEFSLAEDFSVYPGGRHKTDGDYSAECLREILLNLLEDNPKSIVSIDLDGTRGIGSSFLHELACHTPKEALERIVFSSRRHSYLRELTSYNECVMIYPIEEKESFWRRIRKIFYD